MARRASRDARGDGSGKASRAKQKELTSAVAGAIQAGFPIRVAVIGSTYDLGAVPSLWRKPDVYARFLGQELGFVYKQPC